MTERYTVFQLMRQDELTRKTQERFARVGEEKKVTPAGGGDEPKPCGIAPIPVVPQIGGLVL